MVDDDFNVNIEWLYIKPIVKIITVYSKIKIPHKVWYDFQLKWWTVIYVRNHQLLTENHIILYVEESAVV